MIFTLRPWTLADIDSLVRYANNANIAQFMTDGFPHPYTQENAENFIAFAIKDDPIHIFAIDVNGEAIGGIGLHPQNDIQRKNAELGYWLGEPFWGKGIMSQAIKQIVNFGFQSYDIDRIFARPFGSNTASQRILERNHFQLEARFQKTFFKNNQFEDELIYAIRRTNWQS